MAAPAAVLSILVRANTSQASTALLRVNQQLDVTEGKANRLGKAFKVAEKAVGVSALGIAAGLAYSVKKAADFEQQMSRVGAVADVTAKQMEGLRKQALKAGADTKFSALEAAQAQTELAKGGLKVKQILKGGLNSALSLAAAGEMDLADAAKATVNSMKLFGLRGKDAMKIADGLASAANKTTADVSDFTLALSQGGSAAKAVGFSFQETIAALETLAEVGIKGSDAGTSLKVALTQLAAPSSKKAKDMAKELGIEVFDASGKMKSLVDVSKELQDGFEGLTKKQQLQAAKTLVGQDGMRTLLALFDAGPAKIRKFEEGLNKQGSAAETAKKKQDNLSGALENLGGSIETLGISIGTKALPALTDLTQGVTDTVNKISRIVNRDDLDIGEKLARSWKVVKLDAQPWIDKLKKAVGQIDIPKLIADAVSAATPIVAGAAAKAGTAAATGFVRAFGAADAWGKLVIGGWLLTKLGGVKKFRQMGATAGAEFAAGAAGSAAGGGVGKNVVAGAAGSAVGGAAAGAVTKGSFAKTAETATAKAAAAAKSRAAAATSAAKALLPAFAALKIASDFLKDKSDLGLLNQYAGTIEKVAKAGDVGGMKKLAAQMRETAQANSDLTKGKHLHMFADALDLTAKKGGQDLSALQGAFGRMAKSSGGDLERLRGEFGKTSSKFTDMGREHSEVMKNLRRNWNGLRENTGTTLKDVRQQVRSTTTMIKARLGKDTAEGKDALVKNFHEAKRTIRATMRDSEGVTEKGLKAIRDLMVKELRLYGVSPGAALSIAKHGDIKGQAGLTGRGVGKQRGGPIQVGASSGDTVPAMLERGEYVLNRNAVGKVGRKALDAVNFGAAPRFQGGGIVALGRQLQQQGYAVSQHPAFGGVGRHTAGSYHYKGMAIDVNDDDAPGGEAASLDRLYARLKGMPGIVELLWRVAGHFDHLHVAMGGGGGGLAALVPKLERIMVAGADSPLKSLVQGVLDKTRGAAQSKLDTMTGGTGTGSFSGWSGSWVDLMGKISQERGWNFGDWKALVNKESGGNPNATNPSSGAFGLGQFLGKTAQAYAKYGALSHDPVDQIRAMAQYIGDRYGNPSSALAFHNQHNWYSAGGPVGMQFGGNPFASKSGFPNMKFTAGLGKLLAAARHGKPRQRRKALSQFLKNIKGVGLPAKMEKNLKTLGENADIFAGYADRAGQLNAVGEDGNVMTPGVVNGRNEVEWLTQELETLFRWRNAIIRAQEIVVAKREKITGRILQARDRMQTVVGTITGLKATRKTLAAKLAEAQKHPKGKGALIKGLKGSLGAVDRKLRKSGRERETLRTVLGNSSAGLLGRRAGLNTTRGDLLSSLGDVQGVGSPMEVLKSLPGLGVLGGRIFDTQMRLRDLTGGKPSITDSDTSQSAELLSQLLREANLRTAVSERQFDVFKNMPQFGGGGIVPGMSGAAVPAVVHAGEGVFTPDQMAAIGGSSVTINVAPGMEWLKQFITVQVDQQTRRQARSGARGLPGGGGGNLR